MAIFRGGKARSEGGRKGAMGGGYEQQGREARGREEEEEGKGKGERKEKWFLDGDTKFLNSKIFLFIFIFLALGANITCGLQIFIFSFG
jgi:hypothetical protein